MLREFDRRTRTLASDSETMLLLNVESSRSVEILEVHNDEPKENSASTTIDVVSLQCKDRVFFVGLLLAMVVSSFTMYVLCFLCGSCMQEVCATIKNFVDKGIVALTLLHTDIGDCWNSYVCMPCAIL